MPPDKPPAGSPSPARRRRLYEPLPPEPATAPGSPPVTGPEPRRAPAGEPPAAGGDAGAPAPGEPRIPAGKDAEAARVIRTYVYWAGGLSLIPLAGVPSVVGLQLGMLGELAGLYGVPFSAHRGKALIATVGGGFGAMALGTPVLMGALAVLFPLGWSALLALPSTAAASTYAIGRVFSQHFALGGTLLDFRPEETRAFFEAEFRRKMAGADPPGDRERTPS